VANLPAAAPLPGGGAAPLVPPPPAAIAPAPTAATAIPPPAPLLAAPAGAGPGNVPIDPRKISGNTSREVRFGNFLSETIERGGAGDCYFFTVASQVREHSYNPTGMMDCRREHFFFACDRLADHLAWTKSKYPADSPISRRIGLLEDAARRPAVCDDWNGWAHRLQRRVQDLAAGIDWLELAERLSREADADVSAAAGELWRAVEKQNPEEDLTAELREEFAKLQNGLILRFNRMRVANWLAPGDVLDARKRELIVHIDRAIAAPADRTLFQRAFQGGVNLDEAVLRQYATTQEDPQKTILEENLAILDRNRANGYGLPDVFLTLVGLAKNDDSLLPWREITGRFRYDYPRFSDLFLARTDKGTSLPYTVTQDASAKSAHWTDSTSNALVRYVNYAVDIVLTRGKYGGIHELESTCAAYGRPVLHVDKGAPDYWTLAIPGADGKVYVLTGQVGWESTVPDGEGSNPVYGTDGIQELRGAWAAAAPRDCDGRPVPFPDLAPLFDVNFNSLTHKELGEYAAAHGETEDGVLQQVQNKLQEAYEQLLLHCWLYWDGIFCYNIDQGHWQQLVPVQYKGEAVRWNGAAIP
jgi:hypothetical protein